MTARTAWTYQDYAALPDDGKRYEIHDGELCEMTGPTLLHQTALFKLAKVVDAHVTARNLGRVVVAPFDVILSDTPGETTILQPDILFVDQSHREALKMHGMQGPPTLAIEILSPSTAVMDHGRKRALYARYGVPHLWFVDPIARDIEALTLGAGEYTTVARVSGEQPVDLPPFTDLGLVPNSLWQ